MRNYHLAAIAVNLMALASYPSSTTRRVDDYPTPTGTHQDDDAIAKAQAKRDRKAAKRLADADRARVTAEYRRRWLEKLGQS